MRKANYLDGTRTWPATRKVLAYRTGTLTTSAGALAMITYELVTSPWRRKNRLRWGTRGDESNRELPGDDIIDPPTRQYTHAISIAAEPERVWRHSDSRSSDDQLVHTGRQRGVEYHRVIRSARDVAGMGHRF